MMVSVAKKTSGKKKKNYRSNDKHRFAMVKWPQKQVLKQDLSHNKEFNLFTFWQNWYKKYKAVQPQKQLPKKWPYKLK